MNKNGANTNMNNSKLVCLVMRLNKKAVNISNDIHGLNLLMMSY